MIPALGLPVFWALASETAVDIVGPEYAGRAIEKIGFGIVCATVFGIPVGTLISDMFGWRTAFAILAVVALAKALLLFIYLPVTKPKNDEVTLRSQFKILRNPLMQGHILLSILVFSGMFTAYTYLADILERLAGFERDTGGWCSDGLWCCRADWQLFGRPRCGSPPVDRVHGVLRFHDRRHGCIGAGDSLHRRPGGSDGGVGRDPSGDVPGQPRATDEGRAPCAGVRRVAQHCRGQPRDRLGGVGRRARCIDTFGLGSLGFAASGFILVSILLALWLMTAKQPVASGA